MTPTGSETQVIGSAAQILLVLGGILLLSIATDLLGRRTVLPRVTLLLLLGILVGSQGLNLIPTIITSRFELIADMALLMIGFLLGGRLTTENIQNFGGSLMWISICAALTTTVAVGVLLYLSGLSLDLAILLGCIASATAPAATVDTVMESGEKGPFAQLLLAIVALDDAWALILFSLGLAAVGLLQGMDGATTPLTLAARELGGAVLLGLAIGLPGAALTGRIRPGRPMLTEALGLVFLCGGLALWLEVSFLIASMVMGAVIANLARHHEYPFHAIEDIEWPFLVIFFVLAGALLEFDSLAAIGWIGLVYVLARIAGKLLGASLGGALAGSDRVVRRWMGMALLPQAGAAMGMALMASHRYPEYQQTLLSVVIGSTVLFELLGPVFTRLALERCQSAKNR